MEPHPGRSDLGEGFRQLFGLTVALDDATLDEVFRVRHEVYCRDLGWEPVRDDGRESDEFDRHSFHCLLRKRGMGTCRVYAFNRCPTGEPRLPIAL